MAIQRDVAKRYDIIMDGRDIGTYVLPKAKAKFFITASVQERAKRRYLELKAGGQERPIEQLEAEIAARDKTDSRARICPVAPGRRCHFSGYDAYEHRGSCEICCKKSKRGIPK